MHWNISKDILRIFSSNSVLNSFRLETVFDIIKDVYILLKTRLTISIPLPNAKFHHPASALYPFPLHWTAKKSFYVRSQSPIYFRKRQFSRIQSAMLSLYVCFCDKNEIKRENWILRYSFLANVFLSSSCFMCRVSNNHDRWFLQVAFGFVLVPEKAKEYTKRIPFRRQWKGGICCVFVLFPHKFDSRRTFWIFCFSG